jgi:hypothetical protein
MSFSGRSIGLRAGLVAAVLGAAFVAGIPARCLAQAQDTAATPGQRVISHIDLVDADLRSAVNTVRSMCGIDIQLEQPGPQGYGPVTLSLDGKTVDFVLRHIASAGGASCRVEDGVYIIGPKGAQAPQVPTVDPASNPAPQEPVAPQRRRVERIKLMNAQASEILEYIKGLHDDNYLMAFERRIQYGDLDMNKGPQLFSGP